MRRQKTKPIKELVIIGLTVLAVVLLSYRSSDYFNRSIMDMLLGETGGSYNSGCPCSSSSGCKSDSTLTCTYEGDKCLYRADDDYPFGTGSRVVEDKPESKITNYYSGGYLDYQKHERHEHYVKGHDYVDPHWKKFKLESRAGWECKQLIKDSGYGFNGFYVEGCSACASAGGKGHD